MRVRGSGAPPGAEQHEQVAVVKESSPQVSLHNVSLRPQMNMLFKPKTPSLLPKSAISKAESVNEALPNKPKAMTGVVMMQQETPPIMKQVNHLNTVFSGQIFTCR